MKAVNPFPIDDRRYAEWERHVRPCIEAPARWYAKNAAWLAEQRIVAIDAGIRGTE